MRQALERADEDATGAKKYPLAGYYFLANNLSLVTVLLGVSMVVAGATVLSGRPSVLFETVPPLSALSHEVFAGMFGVWGASIALLGGLGYGVLLANKLLARVRTGSDSDGDSGPELDSL